ncbi:hypothetical protein ABZ725_17530 [Streptomyces sp. NPDC006872]
MRTKTGLKRADAAHIPDDDAGSPSRRSGYPCPAPRERASPRL